MPFLKTNSVHQVYYATYGNPKGEKFLFIHGGPGAGTSEQVLKFFDLERSLVVLVDQRGCGKSTPLAETSENNTELLIEDFENIRKLLGIEQWVLFGGSWGSTLALTYAQNYPQVAKKLIIRGIFLASQQGTDWLVKPNGAARIMPLAWANLNDKIPELKQQSNPCKYLYERIEQGDNEAAFAFATWEAEISCLHPNKDLIKAMGSFPLGLSIGKIELYYMLNNFFIEEGQILAHADKLSMPIEIVHGQYDIVCPLDDALKLKNAVAHANLHIMPNSGHSANEPEISEKLTELAANF